MASQSKRSCVKEIVVRGHHVYKVVWTPVIGEELPVQKEPENIQDKYVVSILKEGSMVGHIPQSTSKVIWFFLISTRNCFLTSLLSTSNCFQFECKVTRCLPL